MLDCKQIEQKDMVEQIDNDRLEQMGVTDKVKHIEEKQDIVEEGRNMKQR